MASGSVFECGVCFTPYDNSSHKPLSLPCGHVFCGECLQKLSQRDELTCPLDYSRHFLRVSALPCCHAILLNLPRASNSFRCSKHTSKKLKFLCKVHTAYLCTNCVIEHTGVGHVVVTFRADMREVKADLEELTGKWGRKERELLRKVGEIEGFGRKVISHYDAQMNRVNQAYESAIKALNIRRNEHISQLKQQFSTQMRHLDSTKSQFQAAIDQATRHIEKLRSALSSLNSSSYQDLSNLLKTSAVEGKRPEEEWREPILSSFREGIRVTDLSSLQVEAGKAGKRQEIETRKPELPSQLEDFQASGVSAESLGSLTSRHQSDSRTEVELLDLINSKRVSPATDDRGRPITRHPASKGKPVRKRSNSV